MQIKKSCRVPRKLNCLRRKEAVQKSIPAFVTGLLLPTTCTFCWTPLQVKEFLAEIVYCPLPNPLSKTYASPLSRPTLFFIRVVQSLTLHTHFLVSFLIDGAVVLVATTTTAATTELLLLLKKALSKFLDGTAVWIKTIFFRLCTRAQQALIFSHVVLLHCYSLLSN